MAANTRKDVASHRGSASTKPKREAHAPKHEPPKRDVAVLTPEEMDSLADPRGRGSMIYEEFRFLGAYNAT